MASTSASADNTSSDGYSTPTSGNHNYDSDGKSDCFEELYHYCAACRQPYNDPRVLECLHSFCLLCLKHMLINNGDRGFEIKCMTCQRSTKLKKGNLELETEIDFGRRRYIENLTFNHEDNVICRSCIQGNPAISRCFECAMFLCDRCKPQHSQLYCYVNHHVIGLDGSFKHLHLDTPLHTPCAIHSEGSGHISTVYCFTCHQAFCDASEHPQKHPSHNITNIPHSDSFEEMMFNIAIQRAKNQTFTQHYMQGLTQMNKASNVFKDDLERMKNEVIEAVTQRCLQLQTSVNDLFEKNKEASEQLLKEYRFFDNQLYDLSMFLKAQTRNAFFCDSLQIKSFAEKLLQNINNSKPEFQQLHFEFELVRGRLDEFAHSLGSVRLVQREQQFTGYQQQQQPIARPTTMNRTVNQNHTNNDAYQTSVFDGTNNYRQYNSHNQTQAYRANAGLTHDLNQAVGYYGIEQRSQQNNGYEPQPCQRSSSSPMATSQPNSARSLTGNVFDFSNLQPDRNDGLNGNYTNGFSSTQNQNRSYQTWSNGFDQPGNACAQQPADDIFTQSSMFQLPGVVGSGSKYPPLKRTRMQFISKFGEYGNAKGQFTEPSGVAIDVQNQLIVADTNNNRIQIFKIDGQYVSHFGPDPNDVSLPNKLSFPNRIAVSKLTGRVVITERAPSHRVQTYSVDGKHLNTFGDDVLQHPRGVAVDENDNIIIIECKVMRVTIFTMEGEMLDQFSLSKELQFPNSIAVHNNEIFISDNRCHHVKVFNYKGQLQRTIGQEGLTNYPIAVAINQRGQVVVADNHNNFNITVFEKDGTLVAGYESKTKHAQCFDLTVTDDGLAVLTSKDYKVYCYPYQEDSPHHQQIPTRR